MAYGNKPKTDTFILTLPLVTHEQEEMFLQKSFDRYRHAYNWLVEKTLKEWHQLRKTRAYKKLEEQIRNTKKRDRNGLYEIHNKMLQKHGFSKSDFEKMLVPYQKYWHLNSSITQKIAARVWYAWQKFLFGKGKAVHFKSFDAFTSFAAKTNSTGVRFKNAEQPYVQIEDRKFFVVLRNGTTGEYQREALKHDAKYCTIKRVMIRGRWRYFAQIALAGHAPYKHDRQGTMKRPVIHGVVGIDIGTQTIAVYGRDICDIRLLAPSVVAELRDGLVRRIAIIQRKMDRSRRATNPEYFNENGTIKKLRRVNGKKQRRKWKYSNNYIRLRNEYRELNRRLAAIRKMEHCMLANELLEHGTIFVVEDMDYKALQKRAKETKINEKTGRAHSKKRYGKSIGRCAPAMFISVLSQKAARYNGRVVKVSTFKTKASQFDHTDESYTKKKLSQRFAKLSDGTVVQRDIYSAYLLFHLNGNLKTYNVKTLKEDFSQFLELHNTTKERLQNSHDWLPASVGF